MIPPAQRAAGWCKADRDSFEPPLEVPTETFRNSLLGVSPDGGLPLKRIGVGFVRVFAPVVARTE